MAPSNDDDDLDIVAKKIDSGMTALAWKVR
jgi:hypothetical protein